MAATLLVAHAEGDFIEAIRRHAPSAEVVAAATAAEVLATCGVVEPACCIFASQLSDHDAKWLVSAIRALSTNVSVVPIFVLSARMDEAQRVELLEAGADVVVRMPIGVAELVARVEAILSLVRRSRDAEARVLASRPSPSSGGHAPRSPRSPRTPRTPRAGVSIDPTRAIAGSIEKATIASLLALIEAKQISGQLSIGRSETARQRLVLHLVAGRVARGRAPGEELSAQDAIDAALRWTSGHYEFTPSHEQAPTDEPPTTRKGMASVVPRAGLSWNPVRKPRASQDKLAALKSVPPLLRKETLPSQRIVDAPADSRRPVHIPVPVVPAKPVDPKTSR